MADAGIEKPVPQADAVTQGFWDALRLTGKLALQFCGRCQRFQHFPEAVCASCGRPDALTYRAVSGRGSVYTYVVSHQTPVKGFAGEIPFVIAWIELVEQEGLRILANILNCQPSSVSIGMPVRLVLERRGDWVIPQFEPA